MSGIKIDASGLFKGLIELEEKTKLATQAYADTAGQKLVSYAKSNAPWIDRTGNSRQTIDHTVTHSGNKVTIELKGNTPHFKYLELCHEKKNAILWPTVQANTESVVSAWIRVLGG